MYLQFILFLDNLIVCNFVIFQYNIHKKGENFYMDKTKHVDRKSNPTLETLKELAYYVLPISLMILIILSAFNQAIWTDL